MKTREIRNLIGAAEWRIEGEDGTNPVVQGYAAVWDKESEDLGGFTEFVRKGAFAEAIKEKQDVRALVDHDSSRIIGRLAAGTLRLSEDDVGLRMEIDVPNTTVGRDLLENIRLRNITGASFGFSLREGWDSWFEDKDGRTKRELRALNLYDVSPVTFQAYPDTDVAARCLQEWLADTTDGINPEAATKYLARQRERELQLREARHGR